MPVRCTYCAHEYKDLTKPQDEFTKQVMLHVQSSHPDQWKRVKPNDVWIVIINDTQGK